MKRRALIVGGNANNGSNAGFVNSNSNNAASNTNANIGSQLSLKNLVVTDRASWQKKSFLKNVLVGYLKTRFELSRMKRYNNLFPLVCSMENLLLADKKARKNKKSKYGINKFDVDREKNLADLQASLINESYKTSEYKIFKMVVDSGKEREIYRLPYYPDRILHHAVMNIMEPIWYNILTHDTYSCIKGRGVHFAANKLKQVLKNDEPGTEYCLKLDVRKFYPSVNHEILKKIVGRKIKDKRLIRLLDEIIDSAPGLPIGNYLSQYLSNLYLSYFDHWIKEALGVKYYFRYCDDIVVLHENKNYLHELLSKIENYLKVELDLDIKDNYQVFPVEARGIDYLGYKFFHTHTLLRKSIKKRFARAMKQKKDKSSLAAYNGWAKHCDSKHLLKKLTA